MIPLLVDGPAIEPVTLAEAKTWLKVDAADEDNTITALIVAARLTVEAEIGQVLIAQNWRFVLDTWPVAEVIPIRTGRIIAINGARIFDAAGVPTAVPSGNFTILPDRDPASLLVTPRPQPGRARAGIEIDLRLGFGPLAGDVPEPIRLAIRRLVALWFEARGEADAALGLPPVIRTLLHPFRRARL